MAILDGKKQRRKKALFVRKAQGFLFDYKQVRKILPQHPATLILDSVLEMNEDGYHSNIPMWKSLEGPFEIVRDRACYDHEKRPRAMSVPSFKKGVVQTDAIICISVPELRKIPKTRLLDETSALLIHEALHKIGIGEEDARLVQQFFVYDLPWSGSEQDWYSLGFDLVSTYNRYTSARFDYIEALRDIEEFTHARELPNDLRVQVSYLIGKQVGLVEKLLSELRKIIYVSLLLPKESAGGRLPEYQSRLKLMHDLRDCFEPLGSKILVMTPTDLKSAVSCAKQNLRIIDELIN